MIIIFFITATIWGSHFQTHPCEPRAGFFKTWRHGRCFSCQRLRASCSVFPPWAAAMQILENYVNKAKICILEATWDMHPLTSSCFALYMYCADMHPSHSSSACLHVFGVAKSLFFCCFFPLHVFDWIEVNMRACRAGVFLGAQQHLPLLRCLVSGIPGTFFVESFSIVSLPHGFASGEPWMWRCRLLHWSWNYWPIWATKRSEATRPCWRWCQYLIT